MAKKVLKGRGDPPPTSSKEAIQLYSWAVYFAIMIAMGWVMSSADHKITTRLDRLEKDNQLQQSQITELGDKVAKIK